MRTDDAVREATRRLTAAGVDAARMNAVWLACHACGLRPTQLYVLDELPDEARFWSLVTRRAAHEPLQHIVGTAPFRYLELAVGPGVFVPRPETELLVDAVLPLLRTLPNPLAVDLCAGSGALAIAIATEVPGSRVIAVERSAEALTWLRSNVSHSSAAHRIEVRPGDIREATSLVDLAERVDVVVSNPPYVPLAADVSAEVRADPAVAVFGGADGLALIPAVIARAGELLREDGRCAIEHDDSHGAVVPAMLARDGRWRQIRSNRDLNGRPRYVTANRGRANSAGYECV